MRSDVYQTAEPDENLKRALVSVFESISLPQDIAENTAIIILQDIAARNSTRHFHENNPALAEHLYKIDSYIDSLSATRKALLALPMMTQEALAEMRSEVDSPLLDSLALSTLFSPLYEDKSQLPEWRLNGLKNLERWGAELEMLDLMKACALKWRDNYLIKFKRRDSTHIGLIAKIAELCRQHEITISHTPRSHFMKIMALVFPNLSYPRDAIGEAVELLPK